MEDNTQDLKIQDFSIQNQIETQLSLIKELTLQREKTDSDLALARELLNFLQSKLSTSTINNSNNASNIPNVEGNQNNTSINKRIIVKPHIADENVMIALGNCNDKEFGMTNPEIERYLIQNKNIAISKNGIQASLNRLIEKGNVKKTNPNQQRNIRYTITSNNADLTVEDLF